MRYIVSVLILSVLVSQNAFSAKDENIKKYGLFTGRVSRVNQKAGILRVKVNFPNVKYVNKKDRLEFWDDRTSNKRCKTYVLGKSNDYLLLKVPEYKFCERFLFLQTGAHLWFYSQDLVNNIIMGRELVSIIVKKRLALFSKMTTSKKELDSHIEKVNAVNMRYKVLRDKLEAEWRDELASIEDDRVVSLRNYKELQRRVSEIDAKLEKYKIADENLEKDRWSLDPRLYFKK